MPVSIWLDTTLTRFTYGHTASCVYFSPDYNPGYIHRNERYQTSLPSLAYGKALVAVHFLPYRAVYLIPSQLSMLFQFNAFVSLSNLGNLPVSFLPLITRTPVLFYVNVLPYLRDSTLCIKCYSAFFINWLIDDVVNVAVWSVCLVSPLVCSHCTAAYHHYALRVIPLSKNWNRPKL